MIISEVSGTNFVRYKTLRVKFSKGLYLIVGPNGAGKSLIFEAICWCLYGRLYRVGSALVSNEVVGKFGKSCEVSVVLKNKGKAIKITRYRNDPKHKNSVYVWVTANGKTTELTKATASDTSAFIAEELLLGYESFVQTCIFGQNKGRRFADLSDANRKSVFENLIGASLFRKAWKLAKKELSKESADLLSIESEISAQRRELEILNDTRREFQHYSDSFEQERERLLKNNDDAMKNVRARIILLKKKLIKIGFLKKDLEDLRTILSQKKKVESDLAELNFILGRSKQELSTAEDKLSDLNEKLGELGETLNSGKRKILNAIASKKRCAACGRKYDESTQVAFAEMIEHERSEISSEITRSSTKITELKIYLSELKAKGDSLRSKQAKIDDAGEKARLLMAQIGAEKSAENELESCRKERERLKAEDEHLRTMVNSSVNKIAQANEKIKILRNKIIQNLVKAKLSDERKIIAEASAFVLSDKGAKNLIFETAIPIFNSIVAERISALSNNNISVELICDNLAEGRKVSELKLIVSEKGKDSKRFELWSGGEKGRISLAIDLALIELGKLSGGTYIDFLFLDEVFDEYFDSEGKVNLVELLSDESKRRHTMVVVSHDDSIKDALSGAEHLLKVRRVGKESIIEDVSYAN